ncbi:MAG: 30S ribosomal protein S12 methylthiotransferase RimO, partial [Ruminococcus sp.]|nr:30S ribosomal protein S12 methylthiotransferase RimO [Ruminococcus sp.]
MSVKVGMVSLGCPKNQVDAELMLGRLAEAGYDLTEDAAMADVAIVNTCGFIESAKSEAIEEILELAALKKEGRIRSLIVTGCMAERYRDAVLQELPEVDAVVGIGSNHLIADIVDRTLRGNGLGESGFGSYGEKEELVMCGRRIRTTLPFYSYLRIADGCNNKCAFCAIPMIRGKFRSRPMEELVEEARGLASKGVRELTVIAQDTTEYGSDLYGRRMLPELLNRLCEVDGLKWIRVLYCYPEKITDELLDVIANQPKVCRYLDIPIQHVSKKVLRDMRRPGDRESISRLIAHIREKVPGIVLRTTLMTAFPGETQADFEELIDFVREARFERLGCFIWSAEEDTPAFDLPGRVDPETAAMREESIIDEQSRVIDQWCEGMAGKRLEVMVEGYDRLAECYYGRSQGEAPEIDGKIFFDAEGKKPVPGNFV